MALSSCAFVSLMLLLPLQAAAQDAAPPTEAEPQGTVTSEGAPTPGLASPPAVDLPGVLRPSLRVEPVVPEAVGRLGNAEYVCPVKIRVDEGGVPVGLEMPTCPEMFRPNVALALFQWRFHPYQEDGKALAANFTLALRFIVK